MPIARRRIRAHVVGWGVQLDEDAQIAFDTITSELVTNAVRHATRPMLAIAVHVDAGRRRALVEVYDGSIAMPRRRQAGPEAETGRGLLLVEQLALSHGAERTEWGKRVWAELALPEQPMIRHQIVARPRRAVRAALNALSRRGRPPIRTSRCPGSTRPVVPAQ